MDFGRVPDSHLQQIDFLLPPEPDWNRYVLMNQPVQEPTMYIGCPRWGVKDWIGKVYPKGTKDAQFLDQYVRQFNSIELNSTFYNLYTPDAISKWAAKAGDTDFRFCPKVFQGISHDGSLANKQALMHAFMESVSAFGRHLGPSFLQLHESFGPERKGELVALVKSVPSDFDLFVEVRHAGWFDGVEMQFLAELLYSHQKGLVITDVAGRRDCCHLHLAQPRTLIRFVGNNLHPTDYSRLDAWVERLQHWTNSGVEDVYWMMHSGEDVHAPELVIYFTEQLNRKLGLQLKQPFVQRGLFG